ncbi:MAG: hypothetical protein A2Y07_11070 [Planctomycetes bacterium GWF2_50_10]|nr:MAG: hypothetical protein A2Y07_11070 [Planctomycetes bacterium GWF2_50_10]
MHILYIHQHFAIPAGSTGTRSYEFARRWVQAGNKVTILSGKYDIGGLKTGQKLIERINVDGIDVIIAGTKYSNKQGFFGRAWSFLVFVLLACWLGLKEKNVDVVYVTSTPLTVGIPAMVIKLFRRIPYVFEVRDQWPEVPIELGIIKNPLLKNLLLGLERTIYKRASAIVALSPGMAKGVKAVLGSNQKRIEVIPNCCDTDIFRPDIDGSAVRNARGWEGKFILTHAGAVSKANGLGFLIDVAQKLQDMPDVKFVIIGDGSERAGLIQKAQFENLNNIEFTGSIAKKELPAYLAASDVLMAIFADYPILEHNSANKFFDAISSGKPVLLNYSGWQREWLDKYKAGLGATQGNINEFVQNLLTLYNNKLQAAEMGKNARRLAQDQFGRDTLAAKALAVLEYAGANK